MPGYLIVSSQSVARPVSAEALDLRANPVSRLGNGATVEPVFSDRPVVFTDYLQREFYWPHPNAERLPRRNHPREQSAERRHPTEIDVSVVWEVRQEGNSGCGCKSCRVMELQARISESRRFFRANRLPGS